MKTNFKDFLKENVNNDAIDLFEQEIDANTLKGINVENYPNLKNFHIMNSTLLDDSIHSFDFSQFPYLNNVFLQNTKLTKMIDFSKCSVLTEIHILDEDIRYIPSENLPISLYKLEIKKTNIKHIDTSKLELLRELIISNNNIQSIEINPRLERLYVSNNPIEKLPDIEISNLKTIDISNTNISDLSNLHKEIVVGINNTTDNIKINYKNSKLHTYYDIWRLDYSLSTGYNTLKNVSLIEDMWYRDNFYNISDYYFTLFNYCIEKDILFVEFMEIDFPEDFYDNYISKVTTPTQKKYIGYLKHKKDFDKSNDYLFNYDLKTNK